MNHIHYLIKKSNECNTFLGYWFKIGETEGGGWVATSSLKTFVYWILTLKLDQNDGTVNETTRLPEAKPIDRYGFTLLCFPARHVFPYTQCLMFNNRTPFEAQLGSEQNHHSTFSSLCIVVYLQQYPHSTLYKTLQSHLCFWLRNILFCSTARILPPGVMLIAWWLSGIFIIFPDII